MVLGEIRSYDGGIKMEEIDLRISKYSRVPTKDVDNEIIRLEDVLYKLRQDPVENEEKIEKVIENIGICKKKKGYNAKEKTRTVADYIFRYLLWVFILVYCLSLVVLPVWMILTAFKDPLEFSANQFGWPEQFNFDNFVNVFDKLKIEVLGKKTYTMWDMALISIVYSFSGTFVGVMFTTLMAYVLSKYRFFGRNLIYSIGIIIMIVPIIGSGPSAMMIRRALGIYDNIFLSVITGPSTCFSGLNFLLLYGAFKSLPWDYAEAVFVDGGGHWSAFLKMYLPMALPTMTVIFVLGFLGSWNDYESFMIWFPSTPNLALGLYKFQGVSQALYKSSVPEVMAGFTIVIIPTVTLYLLSQRLILSKFTVGGLKG